MFYVPSFEIIAEPDAEKKPATDIFDEEVTQDQQLVLQRTMSDVEDTFNALEVERGGWLSEAALWVEWMNRGRLVAGEKCSLLRINVSAFSQTLREYRGPYAMAVLYARQYVAELQKYDDLSDLPFSRLASISPSKS